VPVSVDISLYPLKENFIAPIDDFIVSLQKYEIIEVRMNSLSTQLFGEYDIIMDILKKEISKTFDIEENVVLNIKIVNGDSRLYD
tara:strand:- start:5014 stop:5268 length:255 start_codon:yes stop_codon:yes gene_type:complete